MTADVKGAIVNGLSNPTGDFSAVTPLCGTGNCTFHEYSSAGMCSKCTDVTSLITEVLFNQTDSDSSVPFSNLTLPNGLSIGNMTSDQPSQWLNISTDTDLEWAQILDPAMLTALSASIYNFTLLQITYANCTITINSTNEYGAASYNYNCPQRGKRFSSGWKNYAFLATSCALFPCVKTYHSDVTNGILDERVLNELPLLQDPSQPASDTPDQVAFNSPCLVDGQRYDLTNISKVPSQHRSFNTTNIDGNDVTVPSECFYSVSGIWSRALSLFLGATLAGFCYLPGEYCQIFSMSEMCLLQNKRPMEIQRTVSPGIGLLYDAPQTSSLKLRQPIPGGCKNCSITGMRLLVVSKLPLMRSPPLSPTKFAHSDRIGMVPKVLRLDPPREPLYALRYGKMLQHMLTKLTSLNRSIGPGSPFLQFC